MIGVEIPVACEVHLKVMFNDPKHVVPRDMGLLIWNDPVRLPCERTSSLISPIVSLAVLVTVRSMRLDPSTSVGLAVTKVSVVVVTAC